MGMTYGDLVRWLWGVADDPAVREVWNGTWFALSAAMAVAFLLIAIQRGYDRTTIDRSVYSDLVFQISLALCAFCAASSMRAGFVWTLLHCDNFHSRADCEWIENFAGLMSVGAVLAIISGVCVIRVLAPPPLRPWLWISVAALSVGSPVVYYVGTRRMDFGYAPVGGLEGQYDPFLVFLSIAVAMIAAYVALDLTSRSRETEGRASWMWTTAAAVAMGGGIWSMHFIGMLSFSLHDMAAGYDLPMTVLSLIIPVLVTMIGFMAIKTSMPGFVPLAVCGVFIGLGIVVMHYTGMAAMTIVNMTYEPLLFSLSVAIAIIASVAAVSVAFGSDIGASQVERKILAAIIGGSAVAGMHYTGMAATTFHVTRESGDVMVMVNQFQLGIWVIVASVLILLAFAVAVAYDRYRIGRAI